MKNKTVLCLFPRFYIGGVSKALSFVANTCYEAGMEVHCVSMTSEPETISLSKGIIRHTLVAETRDSRIKSLFLKALFLVRFRHLTSVIRPDVIIVFRPDLTKGVLYSIKGKKIPVIASERGNPLLHGKRIEKYRDVYSKCAAVVFQTEAARDVYTLKDKTAIIPNPAIARNNGRARNEIKKGRNIVTVSRLHAEKNIEGLLKAISLVKDQLEGRKLIVYGDGPQQTELELLVKTLRIEQDVVFAGNVTDFTEQNDDSSIFVLNTLSEGMPNALIEAMMSGYACICTDCPIGAPRWLSDNERRVKLVPIKDDVALSQALLELITNDKKAEELATNALEVKKLLDPVHIGNMWLKLINEVIDGKGH